MKKTYHLYFDDTGSRDPDKADLVDGDVRRDRMDCFAFGGVLVKNEEVDGIFAAHNAFCRAHDIDYPLRSWAIRSEERRVGKECAVRVDLGGRRIIKKKK